MHRPRILVGVICFAALQPHLTAQDHARESALTYALQFFERLPEADIQATLRAVRPLPITTAEKFRVLATLPEEGTLAPTQHDASKLLAVEAVLAYHDREQVFDIKMIDLPYAIVGLHARSVLLLSRSAVRLLSASELQAVAAHEIGHEFFWGEFEQLTRRRDREARRQLELQCDGIAMLTLLALGIEPERMLEAVRKLARFNQPFGNARDQDEYPLVSERERFARAFLENRRAKPGK